jgi:HEAT repeat protein
MNRLAWPLAAVLGLAAPARAYIDATPTLARVIQDSTHIAVLEVVKVSQERRGIIFKKVADLKGKFEQEEVKHLITDGLHPREPRTVLDWAAPGNVAVCFANNKVCLICIGRYWYECSAREAPWWAMTRGRPELSLAYYGGANDLRGHVRRMLDGKETVLTSVWHMAEGWSGYESVAFKQPLTAARLPVGRIRARLTMPDHVGDVMNDPRYLVGKGAGGAENVPGLVRALRNSARGVRLEAAENLGFLGKKARPAVPDLVQLLEDPDALVRVRAAEALLRIDSHQGVAVPALLRALESSDGHARKAAVKALGDLGSASGGEVPALINLLRDPDPALRWEAAAALGQIGQEAGAAAQPLLDALKDPQTRPIAADALGGLGPSARSALPALAALCKHEDASLRWTAAVAIIRIEVEGKRESDAIRTAVPVFLNGLRGPDPDTRWNAVWCVKWLGHKARSGVPELTRLAGHEDAGVRYAAIEALSEIGSDARPSLPTIREKLKDPDREVQLVAAQALWKLDEDAQTVLSACTQAFKDGDREARILAAKVLGDMGPRAGPAEPALLSALNDRDQIFRREAAKALGSMGAETRRRVPDLIGAMKNDDPAVRAQIAELLGLLGTEDGVTAALVGALADPDAHVRITAAEALGKRKEQAAALVPVLVNALNESQQDVRLRAVTLLGDLGPPARPAIPKLTPMLQDEDPEVSETAAETLKKLEAESPAEADVPGDGGPESDRKKLVWVAAAAMVVLALAGVILLRGRSRPALTPEAASAGASEARQPEV